MDNNLKRDMEETIEKGKAETEETRAEIHNRATEAKADIEARADRAEGDVRQHFNEVHSEAQQELHAGATAAQELGSDVEREREAAEDRLVQMLDQARERQQAHESQGILGRIKSIFTGGRD